MKKILLCIVSMFVLVSCFWWDKDALEWKQEKIVDKQLKTTTINTVESSLPTWWLAADWWDSVFSAPPLFDK